MADPKWFDENQYLVNKLAQLKAAAAVSGVAPTITTKDALVLAIQEAGMTPFEHYQVYGSKELVDPSADFSAQEYCSAKLAQLQALNAESAAEWTGKSWVDVANAIHNAGMSLAGHYAQYGWLEGVDMSNSFSTNGYLAAKLALLKTQDPTQWGDKTIADLADVFVQHGYNAYTHYIEFKGQEGEVSEDATFPVADPAGSGETYYLTTAQDRLVGTAGDDLFMGYGFDGNKTLQSGDLVDGGAGTDTLYGDVEATYTTETHMSPLHPITNNVEILKFSVQNGRDYVDDGDNNVSIDTANSDSIGGFHVDADRIAAAATAESNGKTQFWTADSRADLVIEDVKIASNKVAVGMQNTNPGDVDMAVFFNANYLKSDATNITGTLKLQLMDIRGEVDVNEPLLSNTYDTIRFDYEVNGKTETVQLYFGDVNGADATYTTLRDAINTALQTAGYTNIVASLEGDTFTVNDPKSTATATGQLVTLTASDGVLDLPTTGNGWIASKGVPPSSDLSTNMSPAVDTTCPLIKTDVYLDNVGEVNWDATPGSDCLPDDILFGSNAGDLLIGSMATRGGVERFDVTVDQGSWLSSMASTNETLRMVTLKNGDLNGDGVNSKGNFFLGDSQVETANDKNIADWADAARYLDNGLQDVAVFDAVNFDGQINLGAAITEASYDKYLKDVDGVNSTTVKDAPLSGYEGAFTYNLGNNDDTLNMTVDGGIAADNDFKLVINAGDGNDQIKFTFDGFTANELADQMVKIDTAHFTAIDDLANVTINTGAGDDVVELPSAGSVKVNAGAGNDVIYADNSGVQLLDAEQVPVAESKAVWMLNAYTDVATHSTPATAASHTYNAADRAIQVSAVDGAQPLNNDALSSYNEVNLVTVTGLPGTYATTMTVSVKYMGYTVKADVTTWAANTEAKNFTVTDAQINAAIIKAINDSDVMSNMLVAKDGAGYSLILESLVDGVKADADLTVSFSYADTAKTEGLTGTFANIADYTAHLATYNGTNVAGLASTELSNNIIFGDAGDDLIILGTTTAGQVEGATAGSHDIVGFSGSFGNDIVENFVAGADYQATAGEDLLDFTSYFGNKPILNAGGEVETIAVAGTGSRAKLTDGALRDYVYSFTAVDTNGDKVVNDVDAMTIINNSISATGTAAANLVFLVDGYTSGNISGTAAANNFHVLTASVAANSTDISGAAAQGVVALVGVTTTEIVNVDLVEDYAA